VGEETEDSFDRDECRVQRDADDESAIEIGGCVRVAVIVAHWNDYTTFARIATISSSVLDTVKAQTYQ
jgi:hypothetical protein